jgi:hypothetical protein
MNICFRRKLLEIELRHRWQSGQISIEEIAISFDLSVKSLHACLPQYTVLTHRTVYERGLAEMKRYGLPGRALGFSTDNPPDVPEGGFAPWDVNFDEYM